MEFTLLKTVDEINFNSINATRKLLLNQIVDFIQLQLSKDENINLNFICTHNSRRSHLCQVWAQFAAYYYQIPKVYCYSGGTEVTAIFPKVLETLNHQGFHINQIAFGVNPIFAVKFKEDALPVISFSKLYNNSFNPISNFGAIMTCASADYNCPNVVGAAKKIALTYQDPKISDNTPFQKDVYLKTSLDIATEMFYVFSKLKK